MFYLICYRFHEKGQWYIFKECRAENLQATVQDAFEISGAVEVKVSKRKKRDE